jgi:hypothetical protein
MLRYRLDDLGAYQFEKLVQSALKVRAGLGVESWGNRGDWGRDSYAPGSLRFPDPKVQTRGSFIFQTKFVEGANSAGARPRAALISSASKEVNRISDRVRKGTWGMPTHFTFITNSLIGANERDQIRTMFVDAMPLSAVVVWGGDDVCDVLDQAPAVARAFPQLLSIRDLDELIGRVLNKESRERSETALQIASELVPVFAPTSSYERAWRILRRHHFAVLEGPPEVGKSAIAWMIGMTQAARGWEVVVCQTPETFFQMVGTSKPQLFIADDAFGRTEYDPTRTSKWEADLDLILHRLGRRRWLIWTSRKHILERACDRMDTQGKARSFPDPGSVLIDVSELSVEERALILFRHARAAGLVREAKQLVRAHASQIVHDPEFTPERMRRFVHEGLTHILSEVRSGNMESPQVKLAITEALHNPTKQMRLTFRGLPAAYKWFLVALLEIPTGPGVLSDAREMFGNLGELRTLYEAYCPEADHEPFEDVVQHLTEAFVKLRKTVWKKQSVDWIHPSYRDLVIDELIQDSSLRTTFLRRASLEGVKLAVSDTGGRYGNRKMPFIRSAESWDILRDRCLALIASDAGDRDLLEVIANAASQGTSTDQVHRWERLLADVCKMVQVKWDRASRPIMARDLEAFSKARWAARPLPDIPDLQLTWDSLSELFRDSVRHAGTEGSLSYEAFDKLTEFARAVQQCAPEFLEAAGFPDDYENELNAVLFEAESEANDKPDTGNPDELRSLAGRADSVAASLERLGELSTDYLPKSDDLANRLRDHSFDLEHWADEAESPEPDSYDQDNRDKYEGGESTVFDINMLFSEL